MDAQEVRYDSSKRFEDVCNLALKQGGQYQITWKTRDFKTNETVGYDEYDVGIVVAKLKKNGLLVDYGTLMTSKECKDYIIIRNKPVSDPLIIIPKKVTKFYG